MKKHVQTTLVALSTVAAISGCSTTETKLHSHEAQELSIHYEYSLPQNDIVSAHRTPVPMRSKQVLVEGGRKVFSSTTTISNMDIAAKCSKTIIAGEEVPTDCVKTIVFPRLSISKVEQNDGVWVVEGSFSNEMGGELNLSSPDGKAINFTKSLPSGTPLWFDETTVQNFTIHSTDEQPIVLTGPANNKLVLSLSPLPN
ncbi:hypothetical protein ABF162_01310 [Vibrio coralliilyticus]|uniref:hypothetical protein n=1 Tax=Vibrio coralliilyticus TaxID=190893 RepID=UPI0005127967|nr:hypothetical protein [Vibrio coralliilyticus]AIS53809.1 hypothetical protein JV59_01235 [Vibrio coralliilyticus]